MGKVLLRVNKLLSTLAIGPKWHEYPVIFHTLPYRSINLTPWLLVLKDLRAT